MSLAELSVLGLTIFGTAFIAGVFGVAGGMILLGVLLVFLDVVTAMLVFSIVQLAGNGWRVMWWRQYVRVPIWIGYVAGGVVAFFAMRLIAFVPSKAVVYLSLGLVPFILEPVPLKWRMHIEWRGVPILTGFVTTLLHLIAGSGGMFLDIFFQKSTLDRKTTIATKSACQAAGHVFRLAYFASIGGLSAGFDGAHGFPLWVYGPAVVLAIAGTSAAPYVLERMTDDGFRKWTRVMIFIIGTIYLMRAAALFWRG
jgi:uncharacterized membrane protein YfcA